MKRILAIALLLFATSAAAVDVTITLTGAQATRVAARIGELRGLKDGQGAPRSATLAEVKQIIIDHLRGMVIQAERPALEKAAVDAVTVPAFDPT